MASQRVVPNHCPENFRGWARLIAMAIRNGNRERLLWAAAMLRKDAWKGNKYHYHTCLKLATKAELEVVNMKQLQLPLKGI